MISNHFTLWLANRCRSMFVDGTARRRKPDFLVGPPGDPYMRRWFILPRNPLFNIYLHEFLHDDDDRAPHDHPWWSLSLMLGGFLKEFYHDKNGDEQWRYITHGEVVVRGAKFTHRLVVLQPTWTLFVTGPRIRAWGFHCPEKWVAWEKFTAPGGGGCGER